ncbi:MAG: tetratricopeptide repeat protein [Flavobacteriaceae bacterium]|nr:tetratricopeptide repeat protein [Flavobacteriaceae bacterium]
MKQLFYVILILPMLLFSQKKTKEEVKVKLEDKQILRKGNDLFKERKYVDAEVKYKKALKQNPNYEKAAYNLGNSIYEQNRFKEALPHYEFVAKSIRDKETKSETFHNIGNATMKLKQYDKAVAAYKNSLRLNPKDDETRYNLALAQKSLKDQQQNSENKDKDKDNKDQDQNKDKNKDKKDQNKDQGDDKDKDQDKGDDNKDKKDQDKGKNEQKDKQPQKPKPNQLSQQQMQQLLEAMNNEEKKTQKKVNAQKAKGKKTKNEKDW